MRFLLQSQLLVLIGFPTLVLAHQGAPSSRALEAKIGDAGYGEVKMTCAARNGSLSKQKLILLPGPSFGLIAGPTLDPHYLEQLSRATYNGASESLVTLDSRGNEFRLSQNKNGLQLKVVNPRRQDELQLDCQETTVLAMGGDEPTYRYKNLPYDLYWIQKDLDRITGVGSSGMLRPSSRERYPTGDSRTVSAIVRARRLVRRLNLATEVSVEIQRREDEKYFRARLNDINRLEARDKARRASQVEFGSHVKQGRKVYPPFTTSKPNRDYRKHFEFPLHIKRASSKKAKRVYREIPLHIKRRSAKEEKAEREHRELPLHIKR